LWGLIVHTLSFWILRESSSHPMSFNHSCPICSCFERNFASHEWWNVDLSYLFPRKTRERQTLTIGSNESLNFH
jgi:hypothetical protein